MGIKMDRRVQKTKEAIRKAYFSLLMEKKHSHITVAELARRANIDRKTFYLHYQRVDDIAEEFCQEKIRQLLAALEGNRFLEEPLHVSSFYHTLNAMVEEDMDFYRCVAENEEFDFFRDQIGKIVVRTIREAYAEVIDLPPAQLDIYVRFLAMGFVNVYISWLKKEIPVSLEELGRVTGEMALWGAQKILPHGQIAGLDAHETV